MKTKKNLVLLGMMGAGKTRIGKFVARRLRIKFFDIDKIIEKKNEMKIIEIFEKKGEAYFRKEEELITIKYLNKKNSIISLGGGAFINEKIRKIVLKNHYSFWLNCDTQTLLNRIKNSKKRPIAFNLSNDELTELIEERAKIYSKAQFKINCYKLTKGEIVKKILNIYESN